MNQYILPYFPHVIKSDQGCFGDLEKGGKKKTESTSSTFIKATDGKNKYQQTMFLPHQQRHRHDHGLHLKVKTAVLAPHSSLEA